MSKITRSAQETIALGKNFAKRLYGGEVVLLVGDLGAGKTTFVQGVAKALGVKRTVNSPTFVLMKIYGVQSPKSKVQSLGRKLKGRQGKTQVKQLVHIDAYRGLSLADLENIGALEFLGRKDTICFVEWGEGLEDYLKSHRVKTVLIKIKNIDAETREIII